jgi:hypothetical protein
VEFVLGVGVGLVCVAVGVLIRSYIPAHRESGNRLQLEELTDLVEKLSEGYVRGIRSVLGLDLGGEVIQPEEEESEQTLAVRALEMDPFMGEELEWPTEFPKIDE